jgi:Dyp-type peroxidase family
MNINTENERKDIQGLLLSGYPSLPAARYLFLEVLNKADAKAYLNKLCKLYITNASFQSSKELTHAVNIAFTAQGLKELELPQKTLDTFSREFIEGMNYSCMMGSTSVNERQILLGDMESNHPGEWKWGNYKSQVHLVLFFYSDSSKGLDKLIEAAFTNMNNSALGIVYDGHTLEGEIDREHFGFSDGISQPFIRDFKMPANQNEYSLANIVNAGEFILGYKNEYDNYSPSPYFARCIKEEDNFEMPLLPGYSDKINLGHNGSYVVIRQMEQFVKKFWKYQHENSKEIGTGNERTIRLAAKMVGRWPNGNPLVTNSENEANPIKEQNEFNYASQDKEGMKCPFGAHIRRTNPRDQVHIMKEAKSSVEMSNRHRMIRRGRIYGEPLAENFNIAEMIRKSTEADGEEEERGLHFICLVSDIQRQFEFIQNVWCNTPTFANLTDETDPIISSRALSDGTKADKFTVPCSPLRNRYSSLPQFIKVVGGGYFFLPGIRALKFICNS